MWRDVSRPKQRAPTGLGSSQGGDEKPTAAEPESSIPSIDQWLAAPYGHGEWQQAFGRENCKGANVFQGRVSRSGLAIHRFGTCRHRNRMGRWARPSFARFRNDRHPSIIQTRQDRACFLAGFSPADTTSLPPPTPSSMMRSQLNRLPAEPNPPARPPSKTHRENDNRRRQSPSRQAGVGIAVDGPN